MYDLFVERRYFKFQNEIQFSSNTIMEQLKHCDADGFCGCNELLLQTFADITLQLELV